MSECDDSWHVAVRAGAPADPDGAGEPSATGVPDVTVHDDDVLADGCGPDPTPAASGDVVQAVADFLDDLVEDPVDDPVDDRAGDP